eukprot:CAMPEP_0116117674 /NCGR_PEP_ID=MMETSP0329-20121206/1697_1 /TAXON_ID=697910 /ORGANISM="Pseudo-nitzschia arenysensis, Strain B593" /LENGTH=57 /DNA_ID=CAMNT_0003611251 /DNA_START=94 /DNA_END=267 /DNA_ORIENTATION=-
MNLSYSYSGDDEVCDSQRYNLLARSGVHQNESELEKCSFDIAEKEYRIGPIYNKKTR